MAEKRKHVATGKPKGVGAGRPRLYRITPEVEEFRKYWRSRLTDQEWLDRIEALAKKSQPLLIELIRQAFGQPPAKVEHSGDGGTAIVYRVVLSDGASVVPASVAGLSAAGAAEPGQG